jgi:hypothetical protein
MANDIIVDNISTTGPFGDEQLLHITVNTDNNRITVKNLLAPIGEQVCVDRPTYGYELHLAKEITKLRQSILALMEEI